MLVNPKSKVMKLIKKINSTFVGDSEIEIWSASAAPYGYGHMKITVELGYNGESREFHSTTSDMPSYDAAVDLEYHDKISALYEIIGYSIIDDVAEWIENVQES